MFRSLAFRIVYTVFLFLAQLLLSNLALPEYFGIISLLILNASLFSLITGLGADTMIMHMLGNNKWTMPQAVHFMWRTVALQVFLFLLLQAGSLLIWNVSLLSNEAGADYFWLDLLYFMGLVLTEKFIALLYSGHRATAANRLIAAMALGYFILLAVFYWSGFQDLRLVLFVFAAQSLLQGIALAFLFFSRHPVGGVATDKKIAYFLGISALVMVTNIVQLLAYRIDYWLIRAFYTTYEVGVYAQANKFANLLWLLPNMATQLLIPRFMSMKEEDLKRVFRTAFYSNAVLLLATVVFAYAIFHFFLHPGYLPGLTSFYIMLPGYFFWGAVIYFAGYFSWKGRFILNFWGSVLCLCIILVADLLLIPRFSINGAAIANTIAYTSVFIFYLFIMKKHSSFTMPDLRLLNKTDIRETIRILK